MFEWAPSAIAEFAYVNTQNKYDAAWLRGVTVSQDGIRIWKCGNL